MDTKKIIDLALCNRVFTEFANATSRYTGRPLTFAVCILLIVVWAVTGPIFHYSDTWQLIINTSTTIVTFLMVFLIQNTQNRDNAAIQAKLDELIRVTNAKNGYIGIERLTDKELEEILEEFEDHAEPLPLAEKSEIIDRTAKAVKARQVRHRAAAQESAKRAAAKRVKATRAPKRRKAG
ncbi:MAG TPA: low affinity iron permease family protein [Caulobacteraceae bacterium]|nr:low affinity iron permease family protein [Caulobacteraceae bacterium]